MAWLAGIALLAQAPAPAPDADQANTDQVDLGRARYLFTAGVVLASGNQFSTAGAGGTSAGVFAGMRAERSWLISNRKGWRRAGIESYFDARLTTVPAESAAVGTTGSQVTDFVRSGKAGALEAGLYAPWMTTEWSQGGAWYSMYLAPLVKAGFTTLADAPPAALQELPVTGEFFTEYSFGARVGVFRTFKTSTGDFDPSSGPESISYVDFTTGRYGDFEAFQELGAGGPMLVQRPWRLGIDGWFRIPQSVFVLGFSANLGAGAPKGGPTGAGIFTPAPDDLRFFLGIQFEAAKFLKSLPNF